MIYKIWFTKSNDQRKN